MSGLLTAAVAARGAGFLAVSGGSTPKLFFQALSKSALDWDKITVTLIDERFVAPSSPRSNQGLVESNLLQNAARRAKFVPLYNGADDPEEGARLAGEALAKAPWPLDVAVLGMGNDGHTASIFPDAPNLAALVDPKGQRKVASVHATGDRLGRRAGPAHRRPGKERGAGRRAEGERRAAQADRHGDRQRTQSGGFLDGRVTVRRSVDRLMQRIARRMAAVRPRRKEGS